MEIKRNTFQLIHTDGFIVNNTESMKRAYHERSKVGGASSFPQFFAANTSSRLVGNLALT